MCTLRKIAAYALLLVVIGLIVGCVALMVTGNLLSGIGGLVGFLIFGSIALDLFEAILYTKTYYRGEFTSNLAATMETNRARREHKRRRRGY